LGGNAVVNVALTGPDPGVLLQLMPENVFDPHQTRSQWVLSGV
jgi:hypothetical protein